MTVPVVVGTGLLALDVVFRGTSKRPIRRCAGGTCGNVLIALSYLGWKAIPVARLAEDRARSILQADLARWGVDVRFIGLPIQAATPIIVERIVSTARCGADHRFSWTCPCCGAWLPRYKPVVASALNTVLTDVNCPSVFFYDRASRGAVNLANHYANVGTLVVFEPSANTEPSLFDAALESADVIKYSDQRLAAIPAVRSKKRRLEIQTQGSAGLRYRTTLGRRSSAWHSLPAIAARCVVDTAGAGDWCTAGFLSRIGGGGRAAFDALTENEVRNALRYGQALSAWNCRFEGARGGMYEQSQEDLAGEIEAILAGTEQTPPIDVPDYSELEFTTVCPSCPDDGVEAVPKSESSRHRVIASGSHK